MISGIGEMAKYRDRKTKRKKYKCDY